MLKAAKNKKQILLVDGDCSTTDTLTLLFETRGYGVTVAHSGSEALKLAHNNLDLILLDIVLPDQIGFNICRKLKESKETRDVSIIILSGKLLTQDVVEGLYLGADDYLAKPFEYEELVARMEAVMRRGKLTSYEKDSSKYEQRIIIELRKIVDEKLIDPYFQPIFLLNPLKLYGFESLSRPNTLSTLSAPELLFKAAIQYGFYQDMEFLAWEKALKYVSMHIDSKKLFLNCNPYLVEGPKFMLIKSLFEKHNIDVRNVFLEITERSAIPNFRAFYKHLQAYRDYGFKFAVDDVGGGYASLESIVETRPEVVKIDRHIVSRLENDPFRRSIVKFIVSFCREHGIFSIAEGIETLRDLEIVRELGVDAGQGYYFQKPSPHILPEAEIISNMKAA
ncbi:MAG TPA: EAL domain-containing protein [Candidatus Omnitrophota bacterium]|nr:EAL domain-containing protein [Candidatus Omnitrophota bacterium]